MNYLHYLGKAIIDKYDGEVEFSSRKGKILSWKCEGVPQPSDEELLQMCIDYYNANNYKTLRAAEYPKIEDQLDTIYHEGIDVWKAQIQAIKDKYPKPE